MGVLSWLWHFNWRQGPLLLAGQYGGPRMMFRGSVCKEHSTLAFLILKLATRISLNKGPQLRPQNNYHNPSKNPHSWENPKSENQRHGGMLTGQRAPGFWRCSAYRSPKLLNPRLLNPELPHLSRYGTLSVREHARMQI